MLYAFNDAKAAERHETQYFEMFCNRGIYHKGWTAVTRHGVPWVGADKRGLRRRRLGALRHQHRLDAGARPRQGATRRSCAELQRLFLIEAGKYNVLPLDDRTLRALQPDLAGRPQLIKGNSQILFGGMGRLTENSIVVIKNKSYSVTAEVEVPNVGRRGRDHRAGRQRRRLEPLRHRAAS